MRKLLPLLLLLWIAGASYWYVCKIKKLCGNCNDITVEAPQIPGFDINDKDFSLQADGNLHTNFGGHELTVPEGIDLQKLADYLNGNKKRGLVISGLFDKDDENGNGELGLARAKALKDYLVGLGVDPNQIDVSFKKDNNLVFSTDSLLTYGPYKYSFHRRFLIGDDELNDDELDALADSLDNGINVYYETGSSLMDFTPESHKYFSDLAYYLSKRDGNVSIDGHTDNTGELEMNYQLSEDRANDVKNRLINRGIDSIRLTTKGWGPDQPIAPNDTEEGRALNRRVEVHLIK